MRFIRNILIILIGIILISSLPVLFYGGSGFQYIVEVLVANNISTIGFYPLEYGLAIVEVVKNLFQPDQWVIATFGKEYSFFDFYPNRYFYSLKLFSFSFLIAIGVSLLVTMMVSLSPGWSKKVSNFTIDILESLPDVFIIVGLQLIVVFIYKATGNLVAEVAMLNEEIYLLPIICLSTVPAVFLIKTALLLMREEEPKPYMDLARAKGLSRLRVLLVHNFRNVLFSLFYRSKIIFSFMLSNLFIIERLFNIKGIMDLLLYSNQLILVVVICSIFIPFYTLFSISEFFIMRKIGVREEEFMNG
jgi:peptide/nickel transport system permease protein